MPIGHKTPIKSGDKFGRWSAIKQVESVNGYCMWICKCDCGTEKPIPASYLFRGKTSSCGCLKIENQKTGYKEISGEYWCNIKRAAIDRNYAFDITLEYAYNLFVEQRKKCALSGQRLYFSIQYAKNRKDQTASLDRIDSTKGYIEGNVQWIHKDLNKLKGSFEDERFIRMCIEVSDYQKEKERIKNLPTLRYMIGGDKEWRISHNV